MQRLVLSILVVCSSSIAHAADPKPLSLDRRVASRLGDPGVDDDKPHEERWSLHAAAGQALVLDINSRMGTYAEVARVVDGTRAVVFSSSDQSVPGDEPLPSDRYGLTQVRATLPEAGDYELTVAAYQSGRYSMQGKLVKLPTAPAPRPLGLGHVGEAPFAKADPRDVWGQPYHLWSFSGRAGQHVIAQATFSGAIELGRLTHGIFEPLSDMDDAPTLTLPSDGDYVVKVAIDKRWWTRRDQRIERYREARAAAAADAATAAGWRDGIALRCERRVRPRGRALRALDLAARKGDAVILSAKSDELATSIRSCRPRTCRSTGP